MLSSVLHVLQFFGLRNGRRFGLFWVSEIADFLSENAAYVATGRSLDRWLSALIASTKTAQGALGFLWLDSCKFYGNQRHDLIFIAA